MNINPTQQNYNNKQQLNKMPKTQADNSVSFGAINTVRLFNEMRSYPGSFETFCAKIKESAVDIFYAEAKKDLGSVVMDAKIKIAEGSQELAKYGGDITPSGQKARQIDTLEDNFSDNATKLSEEIGLGKLKDDSNSDITPILVKPSIKEYGERDSDFFHYFDPLKLKSFNLGDSLHDSMLKIFGKQVEAKGEFIREGDKSFVTEYSRKGKEWNYSGQTYGGSPIISAKWNIFRGWGHPLEEIQKVINPELINTKENIQFNKLMSNIASFQRKINELARETKKTIGNSVQSEQNRLEEQKKLVEQQEKTRSVISQLEGVFK